MVKQRPCKRTQPRQSVWWAKLDLPEVRSALPCVIGLHVPLPSTDELEEAYALGICVEKFDQRFPQKAEIIYSF